MDATVSTGPGLARPRLMSNSTLPTRRPAGRIAVPLLLALGGVPIGLVVVIWFFFFRG
jgi:hypothetical protein